MKSNSVLAVCVSGLAMAWSVSAAIACDGEKVALSAGKAFTSASQSGSASAFTSAAARFTDMRGIALFALGPHRKKLAKSQEGQYLRLAQGFMGRFMVKYAERFNAQGLKVTGCTGNTVTATTASGKKIMFRVSGGRVQDVNVASVWLAAQMRSTFVSVINRNNGDIAALLKYLKG